MLVGLQNELPNSIPSKHLLHAEQRSKTEINFQGQSAKFN